MSEDSKDLGAVINALTDYDKDVLRTACGDDRMAGWGAATTAAVEHLCGLGLLSKHHKMSGVSYEPTDIGSMVAAELARGNA